MKAYKTDELVISESQTIEVDGIKTDVECSILRCTFLDENGDESLEYGYVVEKETYTTLLDGSRKDTSHRLAIPEGEFTNAFIGFVEKFLGE